MMVATSTADLHPMMVATSTADLHRMMAAASSPAPSTPTVLASALQAPLLDAYASMPSAMKASVHRRAVAQRIAPLTLSVSKQKASAAQKAKMDRLHQTTAGFRPMKVGTADSPEMKAHPRMRARLLTKAVTSTAGVTVTEA